MRLFLYPLLITIGLLIVFAGIISPLLAHKDVIYTLPIHKTLYLERGLSEEELYHIVAGSMEWNQATNGGVIFDIKKLPQSNIISNDSIIMMNVTPDFPEAIILDNFNKNSTLAFFNDDSGLAYIAFVDQRINDANYDAVVMHELGHALGLHHAEGFDGLGTLMYPDIDNGSDHITIDDLKQFCYLYHCDASKYHVFP